MNKKKIDLVTPGNSLSIMSSNSKKNFETLLQKFNTHFSEKSLCPKIDMALGRNDPKNVVQVELYGVKFICTMCTRNWNRHFHPFLSCYCQRGNSIKLNHQCEVMEYEEHVMNYKNAADEW